MLAREAQGEDVLIASLRPPVDGRFHHLVSQVRAEVTWIDPDARSARRLWDALDAALALPGLRSGLGELLDEEVEVAVQALRLAAWARTNGVTHLHAHFATLPARTARLAALCAGVTYSLTAHAKDIFHTDVDSRRLDAVLRDAHHVVTVSDHNVGHLRQAHPAVPATCTGSTTDSTSPSCRSRTRPTAPGPWSPSAGWSPRRASTCCWRPSP